MLFSARTCTVNAGISTRDQEFIRLPDSCLIESLLTRDIDSLVEVVSKNKIRELPYEPKFT